MNYVSVPSQGSWGILLCLFLLGSLVSLVFPYPREVTGGSNGLEYYSYREQTDMFPFPLEESGVSNWLYITAFGKVAEKFPFPLGQTGGTSRY